MSLNRAALVSVFVALFSVVGTVGVWFATEGGVSPSPSSTAAAKGPDHVEILRDWDQRRAQAWERGEPKSLESLYAQGSKTGAEDVRMLRAYAAKGLVVHGLETQLVSVVEVHREAGLLLLDVTDRVASARVVGAGVDVDLPADRASLRRVEFLRVEGGWVVGEVLEDAPKERLSATHEPSASP